MEAKDIKDYLHYYLGCEVKISGMHAHIEKLMGISSIGITTEHDGVPSVDFFRNGGIKPILRPLSDMTEEELLEIEKLLPSDEVIDDEDVVKMLFASAQVTHLLLLKHFDLFGLIDAGLAISKIKQLNHD